MRVLVTGGTGYLGAAIVRAAHARGHDPLVFARHATAAGLPGTAIDADIRDLAAVRKAASSVDAVIHAAALVSLWRRRRQDFDDVNIGGLTNLLDVVRARGIQRVVYTSSFLALPPAGAHQPIEANDYQRTKRIARDRALAALGSGAPLIILYPGVVYGPGKATEGNLVGRLLGDHLNERLPGVVGADRPWSFAYIDDVAAAHVTAIEREGTAGEFTLGGVNTPLMELFSVAGMITGRRLPRRIPFAAAWLAGAVEELRATVSGGMPQITRGAVQIFRHDWSMNSERSVRELDYRITPLEQGLRLTLKTL